MNNPIPIRAALSAILAALMFASMGVAVRYSSEGLSNEMTVFLRNGFGLLFLLPWLYQRGLGYLSTHRPAAHIIRALAGLAAMYCFFYAIAHLQLAEAVLLNFSSPLFIAIIALIWLGEKASEKLIFAIVIGFIGVCLILKPGTEILKGAAWVGLVSAVFAALAMVTIRDLSSTEPTLRIVFYFSITATLVSAIPLFWTWHSPPWQTILAMSFAGLSATIGQLLLTYSYSLAPAAHIGPYSYSTVIFAAIYGWIFWAETPDSYTLTGAILIIAAGIITLHRRSMPQLTEPD
ncbi:MAG: DMT family transporter [Gammaproteobacteria bacterium]|nr:DMT family transporter [Gammaproteobacteria bacterium]